MTYKDFSAGIKVLEAALRPQPKFFSIRNLIAGAVGIACLAATPFVRQGLAESDRGGTGGCGSCSNGATGGTMNQRRQAMEQLNGGKVCCSAQGYTWYALWRVDQPEPFWRGDVFYSLARDISNIFGWNAPRQRGSYTDGGQIMGSGARELKGPGGTIGAISFELEETPWTVTLDIWAI